MIHLYIMTFAAIIRVGMAKRKRLLDKLYNGALSNAELSAQSKRALNLSGILVLGSVFFLFTKIRK